MNKSTYEETSIFFDRLFDELYPLFRSITGQGLRESYHIFARFMDLEIRSVPSGTKVFDWTVPQEWHCEEAYVLDPTGKRIIDMAQSNLHVVNYAQPIDKTLPLSELQNHLYSIPNQPDAIPYVCKYYDQDWGFCLTHSQRETLKEGTYRCVIKSKFFDGSVDYAQTTLDGETSKEILVTSYLCHPSMANNELSGPLVLLGLYHRILKWKKRRHHFRFVLHPETIGSLCFLYQNKDVLQETLAGGMVVNMVGGHRENLSIKTSKFQNGIIDKAVNHLIKNGFNYKTLPFSPLSGADERHYASPGINLPVVNVSRDFHDGYPEYHTSLDNKDYMQIDKILDAIDALERVLKVADSCIAFKNQAPFGEPQLGKRGLYPNISYVDPNMSNEEQRKKALAEIQMIKMLLCYSDGEENLIDIADRHKSYVLDFHSCLEKLEEHQLLELVEF